MVVSSTPSHPLTGIPVVPPTTTGGRFARRRGFAVSLDDAGARTVGMIRCDQPRGFDPAARNGKRLDTVPETIVDEVRARLAAIVA